MASGFFGDRQVSAENDRIDDLEATIQASTNAERGPTSRVHTTHSTAFARAGAQP